MRALLALIAIAAVADVAWSHGGPRGFRPPGRTVQGIPCACAKVECDKCASPALREGKQVSRCTTAVTELQRWGDIARVRVEVTLETERERGSIEGYVRLEPAPVFAAVTGTLRGQLELAASLQPSAKVRKIYLWERRRFRFDPLLVLRRGPGRLDLRVFPIQRERPVAVTVEGYTLAVSAGASGVQLYRTGQRCLAVTPHTPADWGGFPVDGRLVRFLSERECRGRFPGIPIVLVPCVPALETAVTGRGRDAVSGEVALAALAPGSAPPPFVGPDKWIPAKGSGIPPGLREPRDPAPPPPPPQAPQAPALQQKRSDEGGAQQDTG
ncbi:MAG: hypothetical protein ACYTG3_15210 [Planctomycetota bacterium]|jgi:hypothetical protein